MQRSASSAPLIPNIATGRLPHGQPPPQICGPQAAQDERDREDQCHTQNDRGAGVGSDEGRVRAKALPEATGPPAGNGYRVRGVIACWRALVKLLSYS